MNFDKLLVVGTSGDIERFGKEVFDAAKENGIKIFSYGTSAIYLHSIGVKPDYYCFYDPTAIKQVDDLMEEGFFKDTSLLVFDLYSNECKSFFKLKYSADILRNKKEKRKFYAKEKEFGKYFKEYIKLPFEVKDEIEIRDLFSKSLYRYNFPRTKIHATSCKFSFAVLPLIFFFFKNVKSIFVIGFGHYKMSRYIDQSPNRGYRSYKSSYENYKEVLIEYIKEKKIRLKFLGSESFYKDLDLDA